MRSLLCLIVSRAHTWRTLRPDFRWVESTFRNTNRLESSRFESIRQNFSPSFATWLPVSRVPLNGLPVSRNKIRTDFKRSQSGARMTKFHCEKISFVQSATRTTKFHWWWMNVLKETSSDSRCTQKNARFEKWPREGLLLFAQLKNSF